MTLPRRFTPWDVVLALAVLAQAGYVALILYREGR